MKNVINFLSYFAEIFLEWEMFQTKLGRKLCYSFFYESLSIYENFWKNCGRPRQATDDNAIRRMRWHADD
jgi:hypothetical protein